MTVTESYKKGMAAKHVAVEQALSDFVKGIELAGTSDDGEVGITIVITGQNEIQLKFAFENVDELISILKLNARG